MDEKISYNNIYTIFNVNKEEGDEKVSNEKILPSNWKKHCTSI